MAYVHSSSYFYHHWTKGGCRYCYRHEEWMRGAGTIQRSTPSSCPRDTATPTVGMPFLYLCLVSCELYGGVVSCPCVYFFIFYISVLAGDEGTGGEAMPDEWVATSWANYARAVNKAARALLALHSNSGEDRSYDGSLRVGLLAKASPVRAASLLALDSCGASSARG
jgi:hypothetical protein